MDATQTQRQGRPVVRLTMLAGLGALGVLFWMLVNLLFGGSAAHAETNSAPGGGLLGGVTGTVSKVTGGLTDTVTKVTGGLTSTVSKVTSTTTRAASHAVEHTTPSVAKIPVVGAVTTPVVKTAQHTVQTVTTKVVEPVLAPVVTSVRAGIVNPIVTPVVKVVDAVPVVGDVVKATGIDTTLTGVASAADKTVGSIAGGTTDAVTGILVPSLTGDPTTAGPGSDPTVGLPGATPLLSGSSLPGASVRGTVSVHAGALPSASAPTRTAGDTMLTLTRSFAAVTAVFSGEAAAAWFPSASVPAAAGGPLAGLSAPCAPGGFCSFSPSGTAAGAAGALSAFAFAVAYRAWMRRREQDDRVPHAPVYATDTSPD